MLPTATAPAFYPPITPHAVAARATGLERPCSATRVRKKGNRPHQPIMRVDNQQHCLQSIVRRCQPGLAQRAMDSFAAINRTKTAGRGETHQRTRQGLCFAPTVPRAYRSPLTSHRAPRNTLCSNETPIRRHVFADQRRVCTRALSRPLTLLEADARASRARPCETQELAAKPLLLDRRQEYPGGVPGGRKSSPVLDRDLVAIFRGPASEYWAGLFLKILTGLPFGALARLARAFFWFGAAQQRPTGKATRRLAKGLERANG